MANNETNGNSLASLLDLSTTFHRRFITVDGKKYEIRSLKEFSFKEQKAFIRHGRVMSDGIRDEDESSDEVPAMAMNDIFLKIVINGDDLKDRLTDNQKVEVLNAFLREAGLLKDSEQSPEKPKSPSSSQEDSSVSSEVAPKIG